MSYRSITDIAKDVRTQLKAEFPACKFSVQCERYSMGQSIHLSLMSAPFDAFSNGLGYAQLNEHSFADDRKHHLKLENYKPEDLRSHASHLTEEAWDVLTRAVKIANAENWDRSDSMTDHFDVNYYFHLAVGKWNKPFVKTAN